MAVHDKPIHRQFDAHQSDAFWRNKRVIVTGGSGFLGSYVVSLGSEVHKKVVRDVYESLTLDIIHPLNEKSILM